MNKFEREGYRAILDVRELPRDFEEWLMHQFPTRYMYYTKAEKGYDAVCACGAHVHLDKARSGKVVTCPICGGQVVLRNTIYSTTLWDTLIVCLIERHDRCLIQRIFNTRRVTSCTSSMICNKVQEKFYYYEDQRDYMPCDMARIASFHESQQTAGKWLRGIGNKHGQGWCGWRACEMPMRLYPLSENALVGTKYQYSQVQAFNDARSINPFWYLVKYARFPQFEFLIKSKLFTVAMDVYGSRDSEWDYSNGLGRYAYCKTLKELCGLESKEDVLFAAKHDLNISKCRAYMDVKSWDVEDILEAIEFMSTVRFLSGSYLLDEFHSVEFLFKYCKKIGVKDYGHFLSDYRDYIRAAKHIGMNFEYSNVRTPNDFKYAHDLCIARSEELKRTQEEIAEKSMENAFITLAQKYAKFECADQSYCIIIPKTREDLEKESAMQHNCVRTYFDRIAKGNSIVLFMRQADKRDISLYTVELDPKDCSIVQFRSAHNGNAPAPAIEWFRKKIKKAIAD